MRRGERGSGDEIDVEYKIKDTVVAHSGTDFILGKLFLFDF